MWGYGIKPGVNVGKVQSLDVAPTMAELLGVPAASIDIRKNVQGIPVIYAKDQLLSSYLTITHHGTYGAFAFTKPSL